MIIDNRPAFFPTAYGTTRFPSIANPFPLRPPSISTYFAANTAAAAAQVRATNERSRPLPNKTPPFKYYDLENSPQSEIIRLIFSFADVPLKDKYFKDDEWEQIKEQLPIDQAPILRVNHHLKIFQFDPIVRYLGEIFHLYGANRNDRVAVDMILETTRRVHEKLIEQTKNSSNDRELFRQWLNQDGAIYINQLEKVLQAFHLQGPFSLGSHISIADLWIYKIIDGLLEIEPKLLEKHAHLRQARRCLEKHPQMINFLQRKLPAIVGPIVERPLQPTTKSPALAINPQRHHHHRHHHHHHHQHRHRSKEPTSSLPTKNPSKSPSNTPVEKQQAPKPSPPPPPPPPTLAAAAAAQS